MKAGGHPLWETLLYFRFDTPQAAFPFSVRLAKEERWSRELALRALEEYRRFLFLLCVAEHSVTPSKAVDKVWHLHLCDTRSYWDELCGQALGRALHHEPTRGGAAEEGKFLLQYRQTLQSYREWFGTEPPRDLWPPPQAPYWRWTPGMTLVGAMLGVSLWGALSPPQWWRVSGTVFLWLYLAGIAAALGLGMWLKRGKLVPLLFLFGIGIVQFGAGLQRGEPVAFLMCLLMLVSVLLIWLHWGIRKRAVAEGLLVSGAGACGGDAACGTGGCGGSGCGGSSCGGGGGCGGG